MENKQEAKIYEDENYKNIFNNKKNFKDFLRDFTDIEIFKDIDENEIDDQTERFVEVTKPQTECDTLKMVKVKDTYALVLLEHQSSVDHLMPFRILDYMTKIWGNYIKEQEQQQSSISRRKDFKLPPIVPIVYHTGQGNWTSISQFEEKINDSNLFKDFIPSFKYGIISLDKLTFEDLKQKETVVSFEMLLLKIKDGNDLNEVQNILSDENYTQKVLSKATDEQKNEIVKIVDKQLTIHNATKEQREQIINSVKDGGVSKMVDWFKIKEEQGIEKGRQEQLRESVLSMLERGIEDETICDILKVDDEKFKKIKSEYEQLQSDNEILDESKIFDEDLEEDNEMSTMQL